jgi:8-oxo-dGTP pyrophosphatase MutT (NUDIX family)
MKSALEPHLITLEHVQRAVKLSDAFDPARAQEHMAPKPRGVLAQNRDIPAREAGVLALIYPEPGDGLHVVLTRRADQLRGHSGQISFPGGKRDPQDTSFTATALRETCEELGICDREAINVIGMLSPFYIPPSHFNVYPTVAHIDDKPAFRPNPAEVAEVFSFGLHQLLDSQHKHTEYHTYNGSRFRIPYYLVRGHKVWGATAVMLSELEQRLNSVI